MYIEMREVSDILLLRPSKIKWRALLTNVSVHFLSSQPPQCRHLVAL